MLRLSRARVIGDIERIVNEACPARGLHRWMAKGAECTVERHSFSGSGYGFQSEILRVRYPATHPNWEVLQVSEFWRRGDGEAIHSTKWLKLLSGKNNDVLKWIAGSRE
ncbi:hypothetical protein [Rhodoblastus sp.]|uniref:hypothetical protein n=1 Tax=Rhodoblastus sp. TaxID=1962975 RepID=UPI002630D131|nr:hypothetical protein [Rhodoblastus sp.]